MYDSTLRNQGLGEYLHIITMKKIPEKSSLIKKKGKLWDESENKAFKKNTSGDFVSAVLFSRGTEAQ